MCGECFKKKKREKSGNKRIDRLKYWENTDKPCFLWYALTLLIYDGMCWVEIIKKKLRKLSENIQMRWPFKKNSILSVCVNVTKNSSNWSLMSTSGHDRNQVKYSYKEGLVNCVQFFPFLILFFHFQVFFKSISSEMILFPCYSLAIPRAVHLNKSEFLQETRGAFIFSCELWPLYLHSEKLVNRLEIPILTVFLPYSSRQKDSQHLKTRPRI